MSPFYMLNHQATVGHNLPDVAIPPAAVADGVRARRTVQHPVHPPVVTPPVLQQQNPPSVRFGQRAQMRQQRRGLRRRAEAHGLHDRVVTAVSGARSGVGASAGR